jgi:putative transposase
MSGFTRRSVKVREGDRVVNMAVVVATGVRADGDREVLGLDVGLSEEAAFWTTFLRSLVARGLQGVRLVISDAHEGLRQAIQTVMQGASWQRGRVHFLRNVLSQVPKASQAMVAALVRTVFVQPDRKAAGAQLTQVVAMLRDRYPKAAELLEAAAEDVLAFMQAPPEHWRQVYSTNPLERLNKEIGRRTDVVGIFPNRAAVFRLVGAVLLEQNDEWIAAPRRYFSLESMAKLEPASETVLALPPAL